jgi:hypothetical protein
MITMTNEAKSPVEISLPQDLFTALDGKITEMHGMGFSELATERPADAYSYVNRIVQGVAAGTDKVKIDGMELTNKLDGEEAVRGAARNAIERSKVDTDIEPVDVVISVFGRPRFRDAIRGRETAPVKVISFHVEPPNLAF